MDVNENYHLAKKGRNSPTDLPQDILLEILSLAPLETLLAFRSVFVTFVASRNAHFNSLYSPRATQAVVLRFEDCSMKPTPYHHMFDPDADLARGINFSKVFKFHMPKMRDSFSFSLRNSCNGLLYLVGKLINDQNSIIFNPLTNEYVTLPHWSIDGGKVASFQLQLLGFAAASNRYKVMMLSQASKDEPYGVQVHEVGSGLWREIETGPYFRPRGWGFIDNATYFNGAAYMFWHSPDSSMLVYFDFDKEEFGEIKLPKVYGALLGDDCIASCGTLGDRLCVGFNIHEGVLSRWVRFDLWVLRNKGGDDGHVLIKEFSIDRTAGPRFRFDIYHFKVLRVLRNGKILLYSETRDFFCYDPRNKSLTVVRLRFNEVKKPLQEPVCFTPTFVPLKVQLSVDHTMVKRASSSPGDG